MIKQLKLSDRYMNLIRAIVKDKKHNGGIALWYVSHNLIKDEASN